MHPLNDLAARVHAANRKWWFDLETGQPLKRNVGELLMLTVTELSEALEGDRKNLTDTHLTDRPMFDVEMADALIRLLDICGARVPQIGDIFEEKMAYNAVRVDHTPEARRAQGGKKY